MARTEGGGIRRVDVRVGDEHLVVERAEQFGDVAPRVERPTMPTVPWKLTGGGDAVAPATADFAMPGEPSTYESKRFPSSRIVRAVLGDRDGVGVGGGRDHDSGIRMPGSRGSSPSRRHGRRRAALVPRRGRRGRAVGLPQPVDDHLGAAQEARGVGRCQVVEPAPVRRSGPSSAARGAKLSNRSENAGAPITTSAAGRTAGEVDADGLDHTTIVDKFTSQNIEVEKMKKRVAIREVSEHTWLTHEGVRSGSPELTPDGGTCG